MPLKHPTHYFSSGLKTRARKSSSYICGLLTTSRLAADLFHLYADYNFLNMLYFITYQQIWFLYAIICLQWSSKYNRKCFHLNIWLHSTISISSLVPPCWWLPGQKALLYCWPASTGLLTTPNEYYSHSMVWNMLIKVEMWFLLLTRMCQIDTLIVDTLVDVFHWFGHDWIMSIGTERFWMLKTLSRMNILFC